MSYTLGNTNNVWGSFFVFLANKAVYFLQNSILPISIRLLGCGSKWCLRFNSSGPNSSLHLIKQWSNFLTPTLPWRKVIACRQPNIKMLLSSTALVSPTKNYSFQRENLIHIFQLKWDLLTTVVFLPKPCWRFQSSLQNVWSIDCINPFSIVKVINVEFSWV